MSLTEFAYVDVINLYHNQICGVMSLTEFAYVDVINLYHNQIIDWSIVVHEVA